MTSVAALASAIAWARTVVKGVDIAIRVRPPPLDDSDLVLRVLSDRSQLPAVRTLLDFLVVQFKALDED